MTPRKTTRELSAELLARQVGELLIWLRTIAEGLQAQEPASKQSEGLDTLLTRSRAVLQAQMERLEELLRQIEVDTMGPVRGGSFPSAEAITAFLALDRTPAVANLVAQDAAMLTFAVMSWTLLHTTALALHHDAAAEVALEGLRALTPLVIEANRLAPGLVVQELSSQISGVAFDAEEHARRNAQSAWRVSLEEGDESAGEVRVHKRPLA